MKSAQEKFQENIAYLDENSIKVYDKGEPLWGNDPFSRECETYTDAGEDMIIDLEHIDGEGLQEYINGFDINENVSIWWPGGNKIEGKGVPFDNMKEHYEDYEEYLKTLQEVCDGMPHKVLYNHYYVSFRPTIVNGEEYEPEGIFFTANSDEEAIEEAKKIAAEGEWLGENRVELVINQITGCEEAENGVLDDVETIYINH